MRFGTQNRAVEFRSGSSHRDLSGKISLAAIGFGCSRFNTVGHLIPITEALFPVRYTQSPQEALSSWGVDTKDLGISVGNDQAVLLYGRSLFPRFYRPGDGEQGSNWVAYAPLEFCHMGFELISADAITPVVVMLDRPPVNFPNRTDAVILAVPASAEVKGKQVNYMAAKWIVLNTDPVVVVRGLENPPEQCRLKP